MKSQETSIPQYRRLAVGTPPLLPGDKEQVLRVNAELLSALTEEAFNDIEYYLSAAYLEKLAEIVRDPEATTEEKFVVASLIKNAVIAAEGVLPLCQDTGTATVIAWKGEGVRTGVDDAEIISAAIRAVWQKHSLRFSQVAPVSMFDEKNTGNNLPAQVDIHAVPGNEYNFLFIAKGGGSANKTTLIQGSKAVLNEEALEKLLADQINALGVAACPPYHLGVVIGGTSPERNLQTLKLATAGYLDDLPAKGSNPRRPLATTKDGSAERRPPLISLGGRDSVEPKCLPGASQGFPSAAADHMFERDGLIYAFRDLEWEARVMKLARATGLGAQFGGKHLVMEARVIRLPRHAASCPISIGVSCNAHRNIRAKITGDGVFLEELERNPARFLEGCKNIGGGFERVCLDQPMEKILAALGKYKAGSLVLLDGTLIVARDMAHERFIKALRAGKGLPDYLKKHPVYYAGPAETPPGKVIGSLGPTTAQRMDSYVPELMEQGASLVMLAKGNRSLAVAASCKKYGGCYLGTIGGAAALLAQENVVAAEVIDFPELGMEAVRRIKVKNLPVYVIFDREGRCAYPG